VSRYLLSGAVIAAPMLLCMVVVIYAFTPPSEEEVYRHFQPGESRIAPEIPAETRPNTGPLPRLAGWAESGMTPQNSPAANTDVSTPNPPAELIEEVSADEQAAHWEEQAFSEQSDLQTRAEALVNLTQVDSVRGEYALGTMIASDHVDDRQLGIALLREWRIRTGDPDGSIAALLMQAASDPDAGVAYQAKADLDSGGRNEQMYQSYPPGSVEDSYQEAGVQF